MSSVIRLPERLYKRLGKYAEGFETPVQVIERLLNQLEGVEENEGENETEENFDDRNRLPIKLTPSDVVLFKERLLETRMAQILIHYTNGRNESKVWQAYRFSETSNVMGNLRSRPEFRQGEWQLQNIKYISVSILE